MTKRLVKTRVCAPGGYTVSFLLWLGVPRNMLYCSTRNGSFWTRKVNHLEVLEVATKKFRERIKPVHPDLGGDAAEAARINNLWTATKRRFARYGHQLA